MLSVFLKKDGTPSAAAIILAASIRSTIKYASDPAARTVRLHLVAYAGKGRYSRYSDADHRAAIDVLTAAGIPFTRGNDAPRGGRRGDFIELTREDAARFLERVDAAKEPAPRERLPVARVWHAIGGAGNLI